MAAERCPLCQSKLKNGECESCGYRLPDESDISAYYNYDPSDYPQEQPAVREITPEVQTEEIYPNRPEPIDFKVRDDQGKTLQGGSPYQGSGQNGQQGQPYGSQQRQQPYYGNNGSHQQNNGNASQNTGGLGEFLARYWWLVLISFFFPLIGVAFYIILVQTNFLKIDREFRKLIILIIVLGFIFPPFT